MATKKGEKLVNILIPEDPQNPDFKIVRFQRDGVWFHVVRGELTEVPEWVKESAIQAGFIKK